MTAGQLLGLALLAAGAVGVLCVALALVFPRSSGRHRDKKII